MKNNNKQMNNMESRKQLRIVTYNCQLIDESKLPFISQLFQDNDFLMIQEHGLYVGQF